MDVVQARQAVEIHPLTKEELKAVERGLPRYPGKHRERLDGQRRGECVYFVAWAGEHPVGHLNLRLGGPKLSERAKEFDAAQIEDLSVMPSHRRKGVATELMRRAQWEAEARGFGAVGLGVDIGNLPARELYRKEGYAESGLGRFLVSYPYLDERGVERQAHETCTYLVKQLG